MVEDDCRGVEVMLCGVESDGGNIDLGGGRHVAWV
jgi:hypothetical protein